MKTIDEIVSDLETLLVEGQELDEKRLNDLGHSCLKASALCGNPEKDLLQNLATYFFNKRMEKLCAK